MTATLAGLGALYHAGKGAFVILDVPELGYAMVEGAGAPEDDEFAAAIQALYTVSYGAHFAVKKEQGQAPRVMPLEAQWWVDTDDQEFVRAVVAGAATMTDSNRHAWRWQAMIVQPEPIDAALVARVVDQAAAKKDLPALRRLRYERWAEGPCAQVLHVGPYSAEGPSIARLHEGIAAAGYRPRGRHHEIYLGDPRRSAPERLRTLLRQPIEPLPG